MEDRISPYYYYVYQGWVPGIYTSCEDFLEQTHEHQYCSWQRHDTLEEALDAWLVYFGGGNRDVGKKRIADGKAPDPVQPDDQREKEKNALRALQARYHQEEMVNPQPTGLVPDKPLKDPLIHAEIRSWLDKACEKLDIPNPIYKCLMQTYHNGRRCYRHIVSIVPPPSYEPLVVASRIAFNPAISWEDAARLCIRQLCSMLDTYIHDYNYDIVDEWRAKYIYVARQITTLEATVKHLTDCNDALEERFYSQGQGSRGRGSRARSNSRRGR